MKAIRVHQHGPPSVMTLEEMPEPSPARGQVVVRVHAIGVNPVDTYIRAGVNNYSARLPYTPGMDAAGVVEAVGEDVKRVKAGDRVYVGGTLTGAYAQKTLCLEAQVHPLPERLSFAQGAAINVPYATAYRALHQRAHVLPGEVVLVHGASGGVGSAAVQLARAAGLTVIGTGGTDKGRELVRKEGAHHVLDHRADGYLEQVKALTQGRGVDVILEMLANVNLGKDLTVLAPGGRVVVIGSRGTVEINPRDTMGRDAAILGMSLMNLGDADRVRIHAALQPGFENGSLRPIVGQELPLSEAPRAHDLVIAPGSYGKIVLVP
ncbi:MAG TPA: NADPH:quinone reductase [Myxococcaceae bacterium]|nr:NADPH:quinone reductase [Myxococcaceae bacterium]